MKILAEYGRDDLAKVYIAQMRRGIGAEKNQQSRCIEFVESMQPPLSREKKWVLIVSSMFGCPVQCKMCDAGGDFSGCLTAKEIHSQIDFMVRRRFPQGKPMTEKFKIQFARMGEPSLNPAVLKVLEQLPSRYDTPGLHISVSSVAPHGTAPQIFFDKLIQIKNTYYTEGRFQLQFSIHTTDTKKRDELIPIKKWSFPEIAAFGERFCIPDNGDKKITLNFAPIIGYSIDVESLLDYFDPDLFLIKITPVNPTYRSQEASFVSAINPSDSTTANSLIYLLQKQGYEVILSIGELEENRIGSNCGQFIQRALNGCKPPLQGYDLQRYNITISE